MWEQLNRRETSGTTSIKETVSWFIIIIFSFYLFFYITSQRLGNRFINGIRPGLQWKGALGLRAHSKEIYDFFPLFIYLQSGVSVIHCLSLFHKDSINCFCFFLSIFKSLLFLFLHIITSQRLESTVDIQIGRGRDYEPTTDSRNRIPFTATAQSVWEASGLVRLEPLCLRVYLSLCLSVCRCVSVCRCACLPVYCVHRVYKGTVDKI